MTNKEKITTANAAATTATTPTTMSRITIAATRPNKGIALPTAPTFTEPRTILTPTHITSAEVSNQMLSSTKLTTATAANIDIIEQKQTIATKSWSSSRHTVTKKMAA